MSARLGKSLGFALAFALGFVYGADPLFPDPFADDGIHLNFDTGVHYVKVPGADPTIAPFDTLFTFARGSIGTYTGDDGLIKTVGVNAPRVESIGTYGLTPHNLIRTSEQPGYGISWGQNGGTTTPNAAIAPDGSKTAAVLRTVTGSGEGVYGNILAGSMVIGRTYVASTYAKAIDGVNPKFRIGSDTTPALAVVDFDLTAVSGGNIGADVVSWSIIDVGNGWRWCTVTFVATATGTNIVQYVNPTSATAGTIAIWRPSFEQRSVADRTQYAPTYGNQILPLPSFTRARRGLLSEGARTNLILQSEVLGTTWVAAQSTITSNAITAPDGTTTMDKIVEDGTNNTHGVRQLVAKAAAAIQYTGSFFVKAAERTFAHISLCDSTEANEARVGINLLTGALGATIATGASPFTGLSARVKEHINGIWRVEITATTNADVGVILRCHAATGLNSADFIYVGNGTSGFYAWGGQLEQAPAASSYIPTTVAAVTRAADAAQRIFGAEFSQTAGTVFYSADLVQRPSGVEAFVFAASDNTNNNFIWIDGDNSASSPQTSVCVATVYQAAIASMGNTALNTPFRYATAWAANDFIAKSSVNATTQTDVAGTLPTVDRINIGGGISNQAPLNGHIFELHYFPTRKPTAIINAYAA